MKKVLKIEEVEHEDYVVYVDTDSVYIKMQPFFDVDGSVSEEDKKKSAIQNLTEVSDRINAFYKVSMVRVFNSTDNRIKIAADVVAKAAFWLVKKRYAMHKVYDMELNKDIDKMEVKGLDVVRSSFPKKFRSFMEECLCDILDGKNKADVDKKILDFKEKMMAFDVQDIAKNTSVRFVSNTDEKTNFNPKGREIFNFIGGSTAQCKAALAYNDMLIKFGCKETEPIMSGGKIKWVYLKENSFGLDGLAFKDDGKDPKVVMDFINTYIDRNRIWEAELNKKLTDFYTALNWEIYRQEQATIDSFFSF